MYIYDFHLYFMLFLNCQMESSAMSIFAILSLAFMMFLFASTNSYGKQIWVFLIACLIILGVSFIILWWHMRVFDYIIPKILYNVSPYYD